MASRVLVPVAMGLLVAVLFLSSFAFTSAAVCGGAGYDLSSLTFSDVSYNDTVQYVWYFHPCGNVTYSGCQQLEGSTSGGVMLCQLPFTGPPGYPVATWVPESTQSITTWTAYGGNGGNGGNNPRGVQMVLQDGGDCGGSIGNRQLTVNFQCSPSQPAGIAQFTFVNETSECRYTITVLTSATCQGPNSPATANGQVACGTNGLNLAPITTTDLVWKDTANNYTYYYRPCGVVTSAQCANNPYGSVAGEAMMCQATGLNGEISPNTYDIAWWNPSLATWRRFEYNGNTGWRMSIADGTSCTAAAGINRVLTVYYVCSATATTPIFSFLNETSICNYQAVVLTVQACNQSTIDTSLTPCGGPYDLSFATMRDLVYTQPGTNAYYVFRPCGVVDNAVCQANGNTNQSMVCQAYQGQTNTNDIAIWNPSLVTYTPTLTGISMYIADGDVCDGIGPRALTVNFICQRGPPNSISFVGYTESPTCNYILTVATSAVCRQGRQNGYCGNAGYDFSLAAGNEYVWTAADNSYAYYFQPCGVVQNTQCATQNATAGSMMCQAVPGQQSAYDIAFYDSQLVAWYPLTNGYQMFVQDGTSCGSEGYERALTVNFICSPGPATFNNLTEPSSCNYVAFISTPQACAPVAQGGSTGLSLPILSSTGNAVTYAYESITKCGGIYNLLPLSTQDLVYTDANYNWVFRPCGAVSSNANCVSAAGATPGGWMLCQDSTTGTGDYEGSTYNQYTVSWTATRRGVVMQQSDGAACGSFGNRVTRAFFVCNTTATTAIMTNVTEGPTCTYTLIIQTNLVCPQPPTTCGGAGYDVSALTTRGDLSFTNTATNYAYYFNPCGVVANSQCQSNVLSQEAMVCQASTTSNSSYTIAVYVPQAITWNALSNGVQMVVQDGSTCDGYDFERVFTANFLCDQGGGFSMNVTEQKLCFYVATINTGLACSQIYSGGSSSSSGLSGGAIAGIVIGSVVGVLILLALLLVVCCGAAGGMRRKKGFTDNEGAAKGNGRYGDMDEASQSGVEMETGTHSESPATP